MPHARGCLSDCRSRSHSSDTDLNSHRAAVWVFVPVLLPSQLCAAHLNGLCLLEATHSALEVDHDCSLAVQDRFSHPSEVVPVCLPGGVGGGQFSELELGGTGTEGLCAGGNSAGHEACVWKVLAGPLRLVQEEDKSRCL